MSAVKLMIVMAFLLRSTTVLASVQLLHSAPLTLQDMILAACSKALNQSFWIITLDMMRRGLYTPALQGYLGGLKREGKSCPHHASMALALSVHTHEVPLTVYNVSASWHAELG